VTIKDGNTSTEYTQKLGAPVKDGTTTSIGTKSVPISATTSIMADNVNAGCNAVDNYFTVNGTPKLAKDGKTLNAGQQNRTVETNWARDSSGKLSAFVAIVNGSENGDIVLEQNKEKTVGNDAVVYTGTKVKTSAGEELSNLPSTADATVAQKDAGVSKDAKGTH
jgi:hypothetical protein